MEVMTWADASALNQNIVHFGLILGYISIVIALLSVILFSAVHIFSDIKKAKTSIIAIVGIAGIYLLCYFFATNEPHVIFAADDIIEMTGQQMKFVEANLFLGYFTFGAAVLAIIYSAISSFIK